MGTNYYWIDDACEKCGRGEDRLHIGKSSAGWVFMLRLHPEEGIESLDQWVRQFSKKGSLIKDEYGRIHTIGEMLNCIFRGTDIVKGGECFDAGFLSENKAQVDRRGWLRRSCSDQSLAYDQSAVDFL